MGYPMGRNSLPESTPGQPACVTVAYAHAGEERLYRKTNQYKKQWTTQKVLILFPKQQSGRGFTNESVRVERSTETQEQASSPPDFAVRTRHGVVARLAFVSTHGAHVMAVLGAGGQEHTGIWDNGRSVTLQLAVGFGEGPEPIFKTGQPRVQS